ncbi:hypothetical protein HY491_00265 [Candidatus Woesearchaeota archaeon]|nr:hypothetical protein [Candidatus Woesearchaeota archaeon]
MDQGISHPPEHLNRAERKRLNRMADQEQRAGERAATQKKKGRIIFVLSIIGLLVIAGIWYVAASQSGKPGKYDAFAQCLTEKGISMGGADWCSHCQAQKRMFGTSFQFIDYHDCDRDPSWCNQHAIRSYPTWLVQGKQYVGVQQMDDLRTLSGCPLPA